MNSPTIWIVFPAVFSLLLFAIRRKERLVTVLGVGMCILLAFLAWGVPIGRPITLGPFSFLPVIQLSDSLVLLGRRLVLENQDRSFLILIYLSLAFWFGGARVARAGWLFVPLGLAMGTTLTSALAVEPFLYAAILIELAVIISIPLLSPPGQPVRSGVLRYLTFQSLGMPFILLSGWLLTGVGSEPADPALVIRITALTGLGFALFMAIFPFHIWIPMIAEEVHPYRAIFVIFVVPTVVFLFAINFLDQYAWLKTVSGLYTALVFVGLLMIVVGGVWAAFQIHIGRILGFTIVAEIGLTILVIGISGNTGVVSQPAGPALAQGYLLAQLLPRGIALALWALAVSTFGQKPDQLNFNSLSGISRKFPVASMGLLLAQLSLAGFPLLATFPLRIRLWMELGSRSAALATLLLLGSAGLVLASIRILIALVKVKEPGPWQSSETRLQRFLIISGCLMLIAIGLLPQVFYPALIDFAGLIGASVP